MLQVTSIFIFVKADSVSITISIQSVHSTDESINYFTIEYVTFGGALKIMSLKSLFYI